MFDWIRGMVKEKKKPKKVYVPEDKIRLLAELMDDFNKLPYGQDHLALHDFWRVAKEVCPEVREGEWSAMFRVTKPYFLEILNEN